MRFVSLAPPAPLAPFIERVWWYEAARDEGRERVLPSGRGQILVNLHEDELRTYDRDGRNLVSHTRGAAIAPPSQAPVGIDTGEQRLIAGVSVRAGGLAPLLDTPVDALGAVGVELPDVWGRAGAVVRERLLAARGAEDALSTLCAILLERLDHARLDRAVAHAIAAFERGASVAAVVSATGLTESTFLRRFRAHVGMTPKRYARVRRFQRVLDAIEGAERAAIDWARIAAEHGYADQAHLIHDFRDLAGVTPTAYRPVAPGMRNHVAV